MPNCLVCLDFWEDQFEPRKGKKKKKNTLMEEKVMIALADQT